MSHPERGAHRSGALFLSHSFGSLTFTRSRSGRFSPVVSDEPSTPSGVSRLDQNLETASRRPGMPLLTRLHTCRGAPRFVESTEKSEGSDSGRDANGCLQRVPGVLPGSVSVLHLVTIGNCSVFTPLLTQVFSRRLSGIIPWLASI